MSAPRLRSDFWVAAHRRRAEGSGAFVALARRGADEAGAIFVLVDCGDRFDLYAPAPQSAVGESGSDRLFSLAAAGISEEQARARLEQEVRFDPDLWWIEVADRRGRAFLDLAEPIA